jgi:hypothetical protein
MAVVLTIAVGFGVGSSAEEPEGQRVGSPTRRPVDVLDDALPSW